MDLELMIQNILIATSKMYGVGEDIQDTEIL